MYIKKKYKINNSGVRFRHFPHLDSTDIIQNFALNTEVIATSPMITEIQDNYEWAYVKYGTEKGWVAKQYLTEVSSNPFLAAIKSVSMFALIPLLLLKNFISIRLKQETVYPL